MKLLISFLACLICIRLLACSNEANKVTGSPNTILNTNSMKLKITIGTNSFTATLYKNASATAFKEELPMTINMRELNGNEKYFDLPDHLPANASNPGTIQAGDLMLYGSNTLVLFYKTFSTPHSYTRLGRIDNLSGLADALGSGNPTVKFEIE
jgi:hypothetical protein